MDRRTVWAILLMMVIAITPAIFLKRPPPKTPGAGSTADSTLPSASPAAPSGTVGAAPGSPAVPAPGESRLLGLTLVLGRDTTNLDRWAYRTSHDSLDAGAGEPLRLSGTHGPVG